MEGVAERKGMERERKMKEENGKEGRKNYKW